MPCHREARSCGPRRSSLDPVGVQPAFAKAPARPVEGSGHAGARRAKAGWIASSPRRRGGAPRNDKLSQYPDVPSAPLVAKVPLLPPRAPRLPVKKTPDIFPPTNPHESPRIFLHRRTQRERRRPLPHAIHSPRITRMDADPPEPSQKAAKETKKPCLILRFVTFVTFCEIPEWISYEHRGAPSPLTWLRAGRAPHPLLRYLLWNSGPSVLRSSRSTARSVGLPTEGNQGNKEFLPLLRFLRYLL